jgi:hypothetical protein
MRRRPSAIESVMDRGNWEQVFPVELLTLQYAFKKATGGHLSLDAPHPLLQTPLMRAPWPPLTPLHEDQVTASLKQLGQSVFGGQWQLRKPIEARFV